MAASLPSVPRVVFTVVEPLSLVAGFAGAVRHPAWFVAEQVPRHAPQTQAVSDAAIAVARQLGNLYLLMALLGLALLRTTSEVKVVRSYLVALWLGDIGHMAICCHALGAARIVKPSEWNAMAWGNVAMTAFLFSMRSAYLLGFFGPDKSAAARASNKSA